MQLYEYAIIDCTKLPMIALLKGTVELNDGQYIIIDVHGVGYKVLIPASLLSKLSLGQQIKLFTYTHVREEALDLYGFSEIAELKLFEQLIGVSGIGPKTVMAIFSTNTKDAIVQAIMTSDVGFFTKVPRLGKKNAQKIIIELKGKVGVADDGLIPEDAVQDEDAVIALKSFGFTTKEIMEAFRQIQYNGQSTEERITLALKHLGK